MSLESIQHNDSFDKGSQLQFHMSPADNKSIVLNDNKAEDKLVSSGILPKFDLNEGPNPVSFHDNQFKKTPLDPGIKILIADHSNGSDGGLNPWSQPAYEGNAWTGKHHMSPQEKLWNAEYDSLSPAAKIKYDAENQAAEQYKSDLVNWEINGKNGHEPHKPQLPEHDKVAAKVAADEKALETQVRQNMTPEQRNALDKAIGDYKGTLASAKFPGLVEVPPEIAAYNKKIAEAAGLSTESFGDFLRGQDHKRDWAKMSN